MKKMLVALVLTVAFLTTSKMAMSQDATAGTILYAPLLAIEQFNASGAVRAVFRGGRTVLIYNLFGPDCAMQPDLFNCILRSGQRYRVILSDENSNERTVLGSTMVSADPGSLRLRDKLVFEANIVDKLKNGVLILELMEPGNENDGAVLAAGRFRLVAEIGFFGKR